MNENEHKHKDQEQKTEPELCSICWDSLEMHIAETDCNHKFHTKCLNTWTRKNPTCPLCRKSLVHNHSTAVLHDLRTFRILTMNRIEFFYILMDVIYHTLFYAFRPLVFIFLETLSMIMFVIKIVFFSTKLLVWIVVYFIWFIIGCYCVLLVSKMEIEIRHRE